MTLFQKIRNQAVQLRTVHAQAKRSSRDLLKMRSLLRKLIGMLVAMGIGMTLFYLLVLLMRVSSSYGTLFEPGTDLYAIGMAIFMTVPTWLASQCGDDHHSTRASDNCGSAADSK